MARPATITPSQIGDLVLNYQLTITGQDMDRYLDLHLRGKQIVTGDDDETLTVTGVTNQGFNGHAIHGTRPDGTPGTHYIR